MASDKIWIFKKLFYVSTFNRITNKSEKKMRIPMAELTWAFLGRALAIFHNPHFLGKRQPLATIFDHFLVVSVWFYVDWYHTSEVLFDSLC